MSSKSLGQILLNFLGARDSLALASLRRSKLRLILDGHFTQSFLRLGGIGSGDSLDHLIQRGCIDIRTLRPLKFCVFEQPV